MPQPYKIHLWLWSQLVDKLFMSHGDFFNFTYFILSCSMVSGLKFTSGLLDFGGLSPSLCNPPESNNYQNHFFLFFFCFLLLFLHPKFSHPSLHSSQSFPCPRPTTPPFPSEKSRSPKNINQTGQNKRSTAVFFPNSCNPGSSCTPGRIMLS